jgi:hypothetical protein
MAVRNFLRFYGGATSCWLDFRGVGGFGSNATRSVNLGNVSDPTQIQILTLLKQKARLEGDLGCVWYAKVIMAYPP